MSYFEDLKAELLLTHPITGAYSASASLAAAELNAVNIPAVQEEMTGQELMSLTDSSEYDSLLDAKKTQWLSYTSHDVVDTTVGGMAQTIGIDIFGSGSTTATNIGTARNITVSRAEQLGFSQVSTGDVEFARSI